MKITLIVVATIAVLEMTAMADPTAEDHFNIGQQSYDRGDFSTAIQEWRAAYDLSGENDLLFNLAQAMRLSGDCAGAITTYQKFIAGDKTESEQHKLAEDFVRELAVCSAKPPPISDRPKPAPLAPLTSVGQPKPVPMSTSSASPGRTLKIAGLVTGGAGVALLATGLVYGHHASSISDEVTIACHVSCDWATWKDKDAEGRRDVTIGRVIDGAGIAAIVGGAVLYYVGERRSSVVVSPHYREGGAVVSLIGAW